jgi:cytochrome c biogenesis protein CcdA
MAPVIIALIFLSAAQGSFLSSVLIFLVFSIAAASLMVLITMAVGLGSGKLSGSLRISPRGVKLISGSMLALIGMWILFYYFAGLA